jgi:hypothetical protein
MMVLLSLHRVLRRAQPIVKAAVAALCAEANVCETIVGWSCRGVDGGGVVGR